MFQWPTLVSTMRYCHQRENKIKQREIWSTLNSGKSSDHGRHCESYFRSSLNQKAQFPLTVGDRRGCISRLTKVSFSQSPTVAERKPRKSVAFSEGTTVVASNGDISEVNGTSDKTTAESHGPGTLDQRL